MEGSSAASRRYGCPACGGGLRYDIASHKMSCDLCGTQTDLKDIPDEASEEMEVTEFHCPQCGAAVYSTDTEVTGFCSFCGSDVVLTGKLGRTRRPGRIVPFRVTREDCEAAYRKHLKRHLLVPGALKTAETISHFRPVYVPFWSYEVDAEGPARLEGKKSYTKGNYRYEETYDLSMDAVIRQKDILYDASTAFEDETATMLEHTAEEAEPFHPAYLSGFYAQGADVPAETYEQEAAASAVRFFMERVKEETKMDSVEMRGSISENFGLPNARYREELVMMPVWLLAHRQEERVVYTAVNGVTGNVVCDLPVSNGKIFGLLAALAAVIFVLLSLFLTIRPELLLALCAALSLLIQYQFSGAQKRLYLRRTRALEPDFEEKQEYTGPAQALLKRTKKGIGTQGGAWSRLNGALKSGLIAVLYLLGYGLFCVVTDSFSFTDSIALRRLLPPVVAGVSLLVMIIHTARRLRKEEGGPRLPRILCCLACAAGLISLLTSQSEDLIYYICAAVMLATSAVELIIINRSHNEYASRPVPFFGEKEVDA